MLPNPISSNRNRRIRFRPISQTDTAATTGMLNNPVGAMIPNFDNGGGSTGGGSGLPSVPAPYQMYANIAIQNSYLPQISYGQGEEQANASQSQIRGAFNKNPTPSFPIPTFKSPLTVNPTPVSSSRSQSTSDEQNMYDAEQARLSNITPMQASGIYAAPEQALLYYMQRGEVNQIPSNMADSMGLTSVLQDPNSGWVMKNGQWTQTAQTDTGAITGAQNVGGQTLYKTESGARLDQSGNVVWDPATATRDVYGGQFVAEGTTKWERGRDGKVRRVVWQNGRKQTIKRGGGGGASQPAPTEQAQFTGGYGVVNFNTGSG